MPQGKRGGGKNSGQKSNKSPQRGRGGRRFGGSTRAQLDKLITLREYTWTTNANQEVVIHAPSRSDVEKISRQFPKGAVSYQVTHEGKPYKINFDDDEDIDSDVSDSDEDREDMLEAYQEQEAEVIKSIESFFADMPEHEQELLEDYVKNLGLTDQDLVANIAAFTLYENQEIHDDIEQKTKLDLSVPVSQSRKVPNYRQRNMQKSPGSPSPKKSPIKKKTPQKSPKTSPTTWISGGFMNEQENPETKIEIEEEITLIISDDEDVEEQVPFNGQYSDSDEEEEERQLPKKKGPEFKKKKSFTLKDMHAINLHIRDFIEEPIMLSMPFSPMSKTQRFQVSRLASFYGIKTKNVGAGKRCYAELVKTHKTRLFTIEDATTFMEEIFEDVKIEESIENNKKKSSPAKKPTKSPKKDDKYGKDSKKSPNQKKDDKYGKYQKNKSPNPSPNTKGGALVAQNAKPLDDNNLGSRLLKSMGWSGLGATGQGIVDPINAVIKQDRKGLGAY